MRSAAAFLHLLPILALCAGFSGCDRPDSRGAFEDRMRFVIRVFSEFSTPDTPPGDEKKVNEPLADRHLRPLAGVPGRLTAARVKVDYLRVRDELKGRALAAPVPADARTPQALQTGLVPADPQGLWLILWLSLHKGNAPSGGELSRPTPSRATLTTPVRFHFETAEYRQYPNHTAVPLPVSPTGTLACFQTGLAIVPPRTVPARATLRWEFINAGERWMLDKIVLDEKAIEWVVDSRPL